MACILLFIVGFAIGVGSIPWTYLAEILPSEIKGPLAALATALNWVAAMLVAYLFPIAVNVFGTGRTYFVIALVNGGAVAFVSWFMVETRLRSREAVFESLLLKP